MDKAYKERDLQLEGIHHDNTKRLADWGFSVVEGSKPDPKKAVTTAK
jgi:hypothetical protein